MTVLVTGATGFVGAALVQRLVDIRRFPVRAVVRRDGSRLPPSVSCVTVTELAADTDWRPALAGVERIVHLAARVHVMSEKAAVPLEEFRRINVAGTLRLARQAAEAGVKRFVFLSSIKVNGEGRSTPYRVDDVPAAQDAYGISKHEAEVGLREVAARGKMDVTVIRAPLVYGPGVKANFLALMHAVARGIPLPFGAIHNRRSLVALGNIVDLLITCLDSPAAANQTFLVSDGEDLSTTELIRRLGNAMRRPARLFPVPASLLLAGATMFGKRASAQRILGSLQVDMSYTRERLKWVPPVSVTDELRRTADYYLQQQHQR